MLSGNCTKSWIDEGLNLGALPTIADEYIFNWGGDLQYNSFAHICRFISARVVIPGSPTICGVSFPQTGTCKNIIHQQEVLEQLTQLLLSCRLYLQTVLTSCDNQHWSVSDNFAANILLWVVVRIHQGLWSQPIQCCCQNILIWSNFYWSEINTPLLVVNMLWFQYPVPNWMMKGVSWGQGIYGSEMGEEKYIAVLFFSNIWVVDYH